MECSICYREYRLSPTAEVILPTVGTCGHSICNECSAQLPDNKNCPYCNRSSSFECQSRNFLAEDCLAVMENIDLVQSLLPQLKDVILELKERQVELGKDMKKVPKGFISQLKWRIDKIIHSKKDTVKLQKRLDNLIDQTTAVIRPKLIAISTIRPFGLLQVEARSVSTLAVDVPVHGPVVEVNGCSWRTYIKKTLENDELYFCIGLEMRAPDKSKKKYRGYGKFAVLSQKNNIPDLNVLVCATFEGVHSRQLISIRWHWDNVVSDSAGFVMNDRVFVQCSKWEVKEIE